MVALVVHGLIRDRYVATISFGEAESESVAWCIFLVFWLSLFTHEPRPHGSTDDSVDEKFKTLERPFSFPNMKFSLFFLFAGAAIKDILTIRPFLSQSVLAISALLTCIPQVKSDEYITTSSGLKYMVTQKGHGNVPQKNQMIETHYTGWLENFDSSRKFDSSRDRQVPFTFRLGQGRVIPGWDECFSTMQIGERRKVIIPPSLGYGNRGAGGVIPPGATLYFDVELLAILG